MSGRADIAERVRALPGVDRLLPALPVDVRCHLVGGAVRGLLGDRPEPDPDVDVAVEGDAEALGRLLADRLAGELRVHDRFGTATLTAPGLLVDLARTRRERYPRPGALPEVEPASLTEDLGRRDFTVNAIAIGLTGDDLGAVHDPHDGRADLEARLIRVLHGASFTDDPTRLLRAVRYGARLGFALEAATERAARAAVADGAPATVSGERLGQDLLLALGEHEAPRAVELMGALGLDRALSGHPADPELVASAKLAAGQVGADPALAALAALADAGALGWLERLGLAAGPRDAVVRAAARAGAIAGVLRAEPAPTPSRLRALLDGEPPEALALALALGAPAGPVLDYVARLSAVRLEITGDDLVAAGVKPSPAVGRALEATLARKLDGELSGREAELRAALALAKGQA